MFVKKLLPPELIPELPPDVTPFSESQLLVRTDWVCLEPLDLSVLIPDGGGLGEVIQNFQNLGVIFQKAVEGCPILVRTLDRGHYDEYETYYEIGYWREESEDEIRLRLLRLKDSKIAGRLRRKAKFAEQEAARARTAALREQTLQTELELVRTLAAKHGIQIVEPSKPIDSEESSS